MKRLITMLLVAPAVPVALVACGGSGGDLPMSIGPGRSAAAPAADSPPSSSANWRGIAGVITAQGVDNPISAHISSGTFAWTAGGGRAQVDLQTGSLSFDVDGLVINGSQFSGTPGPVTAVTGTLVCSAGTDSEVTHDTPSIPLSPSGSASFSGQVVNGPVDCANPLFLIRIAMPQGAAGRWIATGTERL